MRCQPSTTRGGTKKRALRAALGVVLSFAAPSRAQVVEADARTSVFLEPSKTSHMNVITPAVTVAATPVNFVTVHAGYSADIVSGASESVKAGPSVPDVVSTASVHDFRQVATGGFVLHRQHTDLGASYSYGTEHDYRSNTISATAGTDFFQRNTKLEFAYAHGFDDVCDLSLNAVQAPTARIALDQSKGCFTSDKTRREVPVSTDNFQGAWTQSFTPVFAMQVVLTGSVQHGFLSNPYRSVVIGADGESAQEHHPDNRARGAVALRFRYFIKPFDAAVGAGVRAYRDTWDIISQTYELELEKGLMPWLRLGVTGRYYRQTAAVFWSDDYAGGEPLNGPRGQYFSGDREVSPLSSLLGAARVTASFHGRPGARVGHLFIDFETSLGATFLKTYLENFTWAGRSPDDTFAMIYGGNVTGTF
ncbi:MAG TPA: DUF3570 domain-containing protein [Polyangiaceae bacterium]|nr:DUF3570 domain-containing protein [Polyangiaceae bacterium]